MNLFWTQIYPELTFSHLPVGDEKNTVGVVVIGSRCSKKCPTEAKLEFTTQSHSLGEQA